MGNMNLADLLGKAFEDMLDDNPMPKTDLAARAFYATEGEQELTIKLDENGFTVKDPANKDVLPLMLDKFIATYISGSTIDDGCTVTMIGMMSSVANGYVDMVVHNTMVDEKRRGE